MTLDRNPAKRASVENIIKKIEERSIREPVTTGSCSCFSSRRILSSSKSTISLVKKAISSDFRSSKDENIRKLISKSWAKPEKIQKFYTEMLRMQEPTSDTIRLKTYSLLFLYLQQAPILAYNNSPGVVEVLNNLESCAASLSIRDRNEDFIRMSHMFGIVIKFKFFIIKSNSAIFNGMFGVNADICNKLLQEPQGVLLNELITYWDILIKFHDSLCLKTQHEQLRRFIRVSIAEEQAHMLEFMHTHIERYHLLPEFANLIEIYSGNLCKAKKLFELDQLAFPMINFEAQNVFDENNKFGSLNFNPILRQKRSNSSYALEGKFTPVNLDLIDSDRNEGIVEKFPTIYVTANKGSNLGISNILFSMEDESPEISIKNIQSHMNDWLIKSTELKYIKPIGNGSSCEVWLGEYNKTQVAIKKQKSCENKAKREFFRELTVLINFRHPNLVMFMGACFENPLCIVTEYCAGGDLFNLLHKKKNVFISWQQKLTILKEIAKGMIFLHSNSYVHRDLKSLNVLLCSEVSKASDAIQLKISDFGLSRAISEDNFMTGQLGTCHWMAPEVLNSSNYTLKADVYSYGIVMYEVITRETPYKGKNQEEIRTQILLHNLRPDLTIIPPSCNSALKSLMILCWDQDSNRRPSFTSILDILNSISLINN